MLEKSHTTPRRKGPKHPLPKTVHKPQMGATLPKMDYKMQPGAIEPPYYTIDNTEDIYGTNLSPAERCYIDPWDLENYDYVRSKVSHNSASSNAYYDTESVEESPLQESYLYNPKPQTKRSYLTNEDAPYVSQRFSATMPRRANRHQPQYECDLDCCKPYPRKLNKESLGLGLGLGMDRSKSTKYDDYMSYMAKNLQDDDYVRHQNIYNGYGGISSSSSNERRSSVEEDRNFTFQPYVTAPIASSTLRRSKSPRPEFSSPSLHSSPRSPPPAPTLAPPAPPIPAPYDYCNMYSTLPPPYCSIPECYECLAMSQSPEKSLIYAAPSTYGVASHIYGTLNPPHRSYVAGNSSSLGRSQVSSPSTTPSSLYCGIYSTKFGLSKKGLLEIDYSCSWNDLDRIIRRH